MDISVCKKDISFICPQYIKDPGEILHDFREISFHKCFSLYDICWQNLMGRLKFVWVLIEVASRVLLIRTLMLSFGLQYSTNVPSLKIKDGILHDPPLSFFSLHIFLISEFTKSSACRLLVHIKQLH